MELSIVILYHVLYRYWWMCWGTFKLFSSMHQHSRKLFVQLSSWIHSKCWQLHLCPKRYAILKFYYYDAIQFLRCLHADGGPVCDEGVYIVMAGEHQCVCPVGQMCTGVCSSSDMRVVESGRQTCQGLCTKASVQWWRYHSINRSVCISLILILLHTWEQ